MPQENTLLISLERVVGDHSGAIGRAAQYVIENPDRVIRLSLTELAAAANVGQATIVRMGREAGVEGFSELKLRLAEDLAHHRASDPQTEQESNDPLDEVADTMVRSTAETRRLLDDQQLRNVAKRLANVRRIDVLGFGVSGILGELLSYRLLRLGYPVIAMRDHMSAAETANGLDRRCAVIAISQSGTTRETVQFVRRAKEVEAFSVAITAYPKSDIAKAADEVLLLGRFPQPRYGGPLIDVPRALLVIEALALALSPQDQVTE